MPALHPFRVTITPTLLVAALLSGQAARAEDQQLPTIEVGGIRDTGRLSPPGYVAGVAATGTKTDTPLMETPQAITAITRDRMDTLNVRSITDAVRMTAGVNADTYGADVRGFYGTIRSFSPDIYLDGLRLPTTVSAQSFQVEPWGMERIDVIRGSASALYGAGNLGGIINAVSKTPQAGQESQVQLQTGSPSRFQGAFDSGGAINEDGSLRWRLNGLLRQSDTTYSNILNNRIYMAPSVSWTSDKTTVTLLASYTQDDTGSSAQFLPAYGTVLFNPKGQIARNFLSGDRNYDVYSKRQVAAGYLVEHKALDNWTLRQSFRFTHIDLNYRSIYGTGLATGSWTTMNRTAALQQPNVNTVTLDNQSELKVTTGPLAHTILTGLDFRSNFVATRNASSAGPQLNVFYPVYLPVTYPSLNSSSATRTNQAQQQLGLYAQDQVAWDRWRLVLTGRQDFVTTGTTNLVTNKTVNQDDQKFTGRAALLYESAIGVSPYVAYSTSFLPVAGTNYYGNPFVPQTGNQIEGGVKWQAPSGRLMATLAAYQLTQQNVSTTDPANALNTIQTGEVRTRGVELETTGKITDRLNVILALTYQQPEITQTTIAAQLGKRPYAQPNRMAAVWLDYTYPVNDNLSLGLGGGVRYTGNTPGDSTDSFYLPSFTVFDLQARADYKRLRFQVNATNLFDKTYVAACSSTAACSYGAGRTVYASLGYRW